SSNVVDPLLSLSTMVWIVVVRMGLEFLLVLSRITEIPQNRSIRFMTTGCLWDSLVDNHSYGLVESAFLCTIKWLAWRRQRTRGRESTWTCTGSRWLDSRVSCTGPFRPACCASTAASPGCFNW